MMLRLAVLIGTLMASPIWAQDSAGPPKQMPGPTLPAWFTNIPPGFSNAFNNLSNSFGWGTNFWWTNSTQISNAPVRGASNSVPGRVVNPGGSAPGHLSSDVTKIIEQFQKERGALIKNLNGANDTQRQQVLKQLETLRQQIIDQVESIRANLTQQTTEMQGQFNNSFGPVTRGPASATTPSAGTGNGHGNGGGGQHKH